MHQITALPVVLALGVVAFALMAWRLRRRGALTAPRAAVALIACGYGAGIVANTLLPIYVGGDRPSWRRLINLSVLANTEPRDMAANVVLFLPLGILLPLLTRGCSALRVLLYGFLTCLGMELLQFVGAAGWHSGHITDINDLLSAVTGMAIGYGIFRAMLLRRGARRVAQALSIPPPA